MPRISATFGIRPWEIDDLTDDELRRYLESMRKEDEEVKRRGS